MILDTPRTRQMKQLASQWLQTAQIDFSMVAGDASFRKYYRLQTELGCWVMMDAPPDKEGCRAFIDVTKRLRDAGLHAPGIFQTDLEHGFLLLEDLGDQLYQPLISSANADSCFESLFVALQNLAQNVYYKGLPVYSRDLLQTELDLFPDWYLTQHKSRPFSISEQLIWEQCCALLIDSAQQQPQVFVHRDFHSCNLLKTATNDPGIIDYQDAVLGPISYDLASLLWDRYISWPRERIERWCEQFREQLQLDVTATQWQRQCDWMALQRNFKVVGIFARLHYRDHKSGYLQMLPRFWDYSLDILRRYPELADLSDLLEQPEFQPDIELN